MIKETKQNQKSKMKRCQLEKKYREKELVFFTIEMHHWVYHYYYLV